MKPFIQTAILMLASLMLAGCLLSSDKEPSDVPLSKRQQEKYMEKARPPQQYGFSVFAVEGGISYAGQGRLHPNHFTSAEMLEESIPVINMRGRSARNTLNALIDISSPISWMEFSVSQDFKAHFMGLNDQMLPYRGSYNTGGVPAFAGVVTQLRIDNLFIENIPFYIRMSRGSLGPLARGIKKPHIDAIVGYDNLRSFEYVQFDLLNDTISFSSSTPYETHEGLEIEEVKIVKVPGHGLAIEGKIDGHSIPVILDFAGDFSLARGDAKVAVTSQIHLGDLVFDDVSTLVLPLHNVPPRVGRELLAPYIVTVCNREGRVYFEKLPDEE